MLRVLSAVHAALFGDTRRYGFDFWRQDCAGAFFGYVVVVGGQEIEIL